VAAHEVNATGTLTVLEAARARSVPVVVASSSSVYGDTEVSPKHEGLPTAPRSPYAASKLATEAYALAHQVSYGLPVLALRFFNVYGPLQPADHAYAAVVPRFVDAALAGRPLEVHGDGRQSRDFTFVGTVVGVLARAVAEGTSAPGPLNLAFGTRTDLLDLVARLEAILGQPLPVEHTGARAGDVRHSTADGSRLAALFPGVVPVDLDVGLAETVAWFRSGT
jgi:UDP-glucose 4-epimerase